MDTALETEALPFRGVPIEQVHGALLGAAVGDALGWPQEQNASRLNSDASPGAALSYQAWRRRGGYRFQAYEAEISPGAYSDDTQLLLATARSLGRGKHWQKQLFRQELPLWLLYERGGGGATKRAARCWLQNVSPWTQSPKQRQSYFAAGGNGVAMRVLPHVLVSGQTSETLMQDIVRNGVLTHGHPRALLGALVYARAAWWVAETSTVLPLGGILEALLDSEAEWSQLPVHDEKSERWFENGNQCFAAGYEAEWTKTVQEVRDGLILCQRALKEQGALVNDQEILRQLGCFDRKINGSGIVAALAVLYLFSVHAAEPMTGLRTIAFAQSADTDTLASMLGGLFGLAHGLDWLPTALRYVQDYELIGKMADRLAHPVLSHSNEQDVPHWTEEDQQQVFDLLEVAVIGAECSLGVLGTATLQDRRTLNPITNGLSVHEWELRTASGQTLFVTKAQKAPRSPAAKPAAEAGAAHSLEDILPVLAEEMRATVARCITTLPNTEQKTVAEGLERFLGELQAVTVRS